MEIVHYSDLSGSEHETYFVRWGSAKKRWVETCLEELPLNEYRSVVRRIINFANGTLPRNIPQQFESYESLGEPIIYAVKYPTHSQRFYCVYDEINGKKQQCFSITLQRKRTKSPRKNRRTYAVGAIDILQKT